MSATPVIGSFEGFSDVKLVGRQVRYEQLSFWLNPVGAVFTVGFSVVFLILLGASAGNSRISFYGNIRLVQYYVPGFAAYGVMAACFNILAITLVNRREMGLLKRLRLTPLPTWALLSAIVLSSMVIAAVEVVILLVVGRVGFGVHFPDNVGAFVVAIVVGMLSFSALGAGHEHARSESGRGRPDRQHHLLRAAVSFRTVVPAQARIGPGPVRVVFPCASLHRRRLRSL